VAAELLYQRGLPPQAMYVFKHALIQDAAYQSLLRRTRQQYHRRAAHVLEGQCAEVAARQPEVLAHHYTEAGLTAQAVSYWQRAGEQALQRSAHLEAVQHLRQALQGLGAQPETPERQHQELALQLALGSALMAAKGPASPAMIQTYARARALCQQIGDTPTLFPALRGLGLFYRNRGVLRTARELGEQLYQLAQGEGTPPLLQEAHETLGGILFYLGDYAAARWHLEQGIASTHPTTQRAQALRQGVAPGVTCLTVAALALWCLGYPVQAIQRSQEACALAQTLAHPHSVATAHHFAALLYHRCRQRAAVQAQVEALQPLATAHGFPLWMGYSTFWQGWMPAWPRCTPAWRQCWLRDKCCRSLSVSSSWRRRQRIPAGSQRGSSCWRRPSPPCRQVNGRTS
jgi:tetratricopeptide (TPR) repeat protein